MDDGDKQGRVKKMSDKELETGTVKSDDPEPVVYG
jgi:hypothetical protein